MKALQVRPAATDDRALGRLLRENDRALAEALVDSEIALARLRWLLERSSAAELGSALRLPPDGRRERELALFELKRLLAARDEPGGRARAVDALAASPLDSRMISRVLEALEQERAGADGGRGRELEALIARIREACAGAEAARAQLMQGNMPLVHWMARRKLNHGLPLSDLIQEGSIGLMRAIEKFDAERDVQFSTYAVWWIRHFINHALSYQSHMIRVPVRLMGVRRRVSSEAHKFALQYGREPTPLELSARTSLSPEKIDAALTAPREPLSLELPRHGDPDYRIGDSLTAPGSDGPWQRLVERDAERTVSELFEVLKPRERELLRLRFGMEGGEPQTLAQIGERFGLTRERVRQIEAIALKKLRADAEGSATVARLSAPAKLGYGAPRGPRSANRHRTKPRRPRARSR